MSTADTYSTYVFVPYTSSSLDIYRAGKGKVYVDKANLFWTNVAKGQHTDINLPVNKLIKNELAEFERLNQLESEQN